MLHVYGLVKDASTNDVLANVSVKLTIEDIMENNCTTDDQGRAAFVLR